MGAHVGPRSEANQIRKDVAKRDPYWGAQLVAAAAILLDLALANKLTIGPFWLLPSLETLVLLGLVAASPHPRWRHSPCDGGSQWS